MYIYRYSYIRPCGKCNVFLLYYKLIFIYNKNTTLKWVKLLMIYAKIMNN